MPRPVHDVLTAVPVAFRQDGTLNLEGSREILQRVAVSGVQGALVLGTTAEFPALSEAERGALTEVALAELSGLRTVVHVGAASRFETSRLLSQARSAGAREIAILTPYYLPASPQAMLHYFRSLADEAEGLDVYLYLFRARTGNDISEALLAELARLPNIVGLKLSGETLDQVARFRGVVPDDFVIYTGSDGDLERAADYGASGVISGVASVFPGPFVRLRQGLLEDDADLVAAARADVAEVVELLRGDPLRMKTVLRMQGVDGGFARMALEEPTPSDLRAFQAAIDQYSNIP